MPTITIDIPDVIATQFGDLEDLRRTVYEDLVIEQRQQGKLSLGEAAKLLGLTYTEFFELLGRKGLSFINATPDEIEEDYRQFRQIMQTPER
jgi:predicted HTH domain antitoxin